MVASLCGKQYKWEIANGRQIADTSKRNGVFTKVERYKTNYL